MEQIENDFIAGMLLGGSIVALLLSIIFFINV